MDSTAKPGRTVAMCAAMQGVGGGLGWSLLPALMPQIAVDLRLSHALGGLVWGAASLGIALASPLGGAAVDRLGARRVAGLAMLLGAAACAARALAWDAWSLAGAMLLFGLHIGLVAPSIPKALAGHVPPARLARAAGTALLAYTLGTALTILVARPLLVPLLGGWRNVMLAAAVAMAAVGVLWLALVRDRVAFSRHARLRDVLGLARDPQLRRVAAMHFLLFGGYLTLLGLLPRALIEAGLAPARVGVAIAVWLGVAGALNLCGPMLSDRLGRRRPILLAGALIAGLGLAAFAIAPSQPWLLAVAALGGGAIAPLLLTLPLELPGIGAARAGSALGLLMLVGQAGGVLLPILTGAVQGAAGLGAALGTLALVHFLILLPARSLRETGTGAGGRAATPAVAVVA